MISLVLCIECVVSMFIFVAFCILVHVGGELVAFALVVSHLPAPASQPVSCRHQAHECGAAGRELGFPGGQVRVARCWWLWPHAHGEKPPLYGITGTKLHHKHRLGGVQIQHKFAFAWKGGLF